MNDRKIVNFQGIRYPYSGNSDYYIVAAVYYDKSLKIIKVSYELFHIAERAKERVKYGEFIWLDNSYPLTVKECVRLILCYDNTLARILGARLTDELGWTDFYFGTCHFFRADNDI